MSLKDLKPIGVYFLSGCCSLLFIVLTFLLSRRMDLGGISELAFMFHLLPFGLGFSGGSIWYIYMYYFLLWLLLMVIFKAIYYLIFRLKR